MGSPLSKGPLIYDHEEGNKNLFNSTVRKPSILGMSIDRNISNEFSRRLKPTKTLNYVPMNVPLKFNSQTETNSNVTKGVVKESPGFNIQWGLRDNSEIRQNSISDIVTSKDKSVSYELSEKGDTRVKLVEFRIHQKLPFLDIPENGPLTLPNPSRVEIMEENNNDRAVEINLSPLEHSTHERAGYPMRKPENKENNQKQSNISKFFENGPKGAMKNRETKAAKRKREEEEMADLQIKKDKDDKPTKADLAVDCSDWELHDDEYMRNWLGDESDGEPEEERPKRWKKKKKKLKIPHIGAGEDSEDSDVKFEDTVENPRVSQTYHPSKKKRQQDQEIPEPHKGKATLGRFVAYTEARKKGNIDNLTNRDGKKPPMPGLDIMDPGDGEDDWGADRQLEPPPETVIVPWTPYGFKEVVAEDGTVRYEMPDQQYEKATLTTLGLVYTEPMTPEEVEIYKKEKQKEEEEKLRNPPEQEEDVSDSSSTTEYSEDYDATWEEFEEAEYLKNPPPYGIPTNYQPYQPRLEDDPDYLSDADETKPMETRPTERKDLKYLGDIEKVFRFEDPNSEEEKENQTIFRFKDSNSKINQSTGGGGDDDDDDYSDGYLAEYPDEYDDGIKDVNSILIKYEDKEVNDKENDTEEVYENITYGLSRLEIKQGEETEHQDGRPPEFEFVLEDDDNFEDDQVDDDYSDGLHYVNITKTTDPYSKFEQNVIRDPSDEDIDPSDESEEYDSEEDDYEDNVQEEEYNDGIRMPEEFLEEKEEDLDSEDQVELEVNKYLGDMTFEQKIEEFKKPVEEMDFRVVEDLTRTFGMKEGEEKSLLMGGNPEFGDEDEPDEDDEDEFEVKSDVSDNVLAWDETEFDTGTDSDVGEDGEEYDENYVPYRPLNAEDSDDSFVQDHNATDLMNEMELQGDKYDDFEFNITNGRWINLPYKHPGDYKYASTERGEPGKELPFWYFIKHPAEDESLMNIRGKLADQFDNQSGPYNPFKVVPPPTPLWLDDKFDLVPKGVKVPDDFFYGFKKLDPETKHQLEMEGDNMDDIEFEIAEDEDPDSRIWQRLDDGDARPRTWQSWRSREKEGFGEDPEMKPQPKKNDQWQHYRDWLLRQGAKSATKTTPKLNYQTNNTTESEIAGGKFSGKKVTYSEETKAQPRPYYQTWLAKQTNLKPTIGSYNNADNTKKEDANTTAQGSYEKDMTINKWSKKSNDNMWQHYQMWKQNYVETKSSVEENSDPFVFSKPPEDKIVPDGGSKSSPYKRTEKDIPSNNLTDLSHLSGMEQMKKAYNLEDDFKQQTSRSDGSGSQDNLNKRDKRTDLQEDNMRYLIDSEYIQNLRVDFPPRSPTPLKTPQTPYVDHRIPVPENRYSNLKPYAPYKPNIANCRKPAYRSEIDIIHEPTERKTGIEWNKIPSPRAKTVFQPVFKQTEAIPKAQPTENRKNMFDTGTVVLDLNNFLNMKIVNQLETQKGSEMDISMPEINVKENTERFSETNSKGLDKPNPTSGSDGNGNTDGISTLNQIDLNPNNLNKEDNTDQIKPKRKYTRRKQVSTDISTEPTTTESFANTVTSKRKYTRRVKASTAASTETSGVTPDNLSNDLTTPKILSENNKPSVSSLLTSFPESSSLGESKSVKDMVGNSHNPKLKENIHHEYTYSDIFSTKPEASEFKDEEIGQPIQDDSITSRLFPLRSNTLPSKRTSRVKNTKEKWSNPSLINTNGSSNKNEGMSNENRQNHWNHYQPFLRRESKSHPKVIYSPSSSSHAKRVNNTQQHVTYDSKATPNENHSENHSKSFGESKEHSKGMYKPVGTFSLSQAEEENKISNPMIYNSKVYPIINSKSFGDHWMHYKTWLQKKGIQKPLYKNPNVRPEMSLDDKIPPIHNIDKQSVKETPKSSVTSDQNLITDEKIEYLHQRWLTWQQSLASKMVHKLNKMLKYYENPEGDITRNTVKVLDMIKQRDYWREIHRWSSRKCFSIYNKTPPQTHPSTLNLSQPRVKAGDQDHESENAGYDHWRVPDPAVLNAQPISDPKNVVKPSVEIKRPKFPDQAQQYETEENESTIQAKNKMPFNRQTFYGRAFPKEEFKRPSFPDQSQQNETEEYESTIQAKTKMPFDRQTFYSIEFPKEEFKRPSFSDQSRFREEFKRPKFPDKAKEEMEEENSQFPDRITNREFPSQATTPKRKLKSILRTQTNQDQGMSIEEKHHDRFFKEISDLLGQSVQIESSERKTLSRHDKRLERKQKAKYKELKRETEVMSKFGEFLLRRTEDSEEEDTLESE